jgi:hypothetical protein
MEEHAFEGEVMVPLDHESQGISGPVVEPELLDERDSGEMGSIREGEARCQQPILGGQRTIAMHPDTVMEPAEVSRKDASADAQFPRTTECEGCGQKLWWQGRHRAI